MILLKFDGVFDFIKNEEDFLNFVAIYKCSDIKNGEIVIFDDITRVKYNYAFFKTNKDSIEEFKKRNSNIIKYEINEDGFIEKISIKVNIEKIDDMILQYENEINSIINNTNYKIINLSKSRYYSGCYRGAKPSMNIKSFKVPINEYVCNFIEHEESLRLYLLFIYLTYRLDSNANQIKISQRDISCILQINENKVREYINILINNNLIEKIKVQNKKGFYYEYRIIPYEEFMQIKNDNFICDSSKKDKNIKSKKEKMIIEKDVSMINIPSMYYIVYEITDKTNGMKYIGKHKTTNINDGYMGSGRLLKQNQEIKGIENFEKKILHLCKNDKHMAEMEAMEIEKVKAYENNMYYNLKKEK